MGENSQNPSPSRVGRVSTSSRHEEVVYEVKVKVMGVAGITLDRKKCRDQTKTAGSPSAPEHMSAVITFLNENQTHAVTAPSKILKRSPADEIVVGSIDEHSFPPEIERHIALWDNESHPEGSTIFLEAKFKRPIGGKAAVAAAYARMSRKTFCMVIGLMDNNDQSDGFVAHSIGEAEMIISADQVNLGTTTLDLPVRVLAEEHAKGDALPVVPLQRCHDDPQNLKKKKGLARLFSKSNTDNGEGPDAPLPPMLSRAFQSAYAVDSHGDAVIRVELEVREKEFNYEVESDAGTDKLYLPPSPLRVTGVSGRSSSQATPFSTPLPVVENSPSFDEMEPPAKLIPKSPLKINAGGSISSQKTSQTAEMTEATAVSTTVGSLYAADRASGLNEQRNKTDLVAEESIERTITQGSTKSSVSPGSVNMAGHYRTSPPRRGLSLGAIERAAKLQDPRLSAKKGQDKAKASKRTDVLQQAARASFAKNNYGSPARESASQNSVSVSEHSRNSSFSGHSRNNSPSGHSRYSSECESGVEMTASVYNRAKQADSRAEDKKLPKIAESSAKAPAKAAVPSTPTRTKTLRHAQRHVAKTPPKKLSPGSSARNKGKQHAARHKAPPAPTLKQKKQSILRKILKKSGAANPGVANPAVVKPVETATRSRSVSRERATATERNITVARVHTSPTVPVDERNGLASTVYAPEIDDEASFPDADYDQEMLRMMDDPLPRENSNTTLHTVGSTTIAEESLPTISETNIMDVIACGQRSVADKVLDSTSWANFDDTGDSRSGITWSTRDTRDSFMDGFCSVPRGGNSSDKGMFSCQSNTVEDTNERRKRLWKDRMISIRDGSLVDETGAIAEKDEAAIASLDSVETDFSEDTSPQMNDETGELQAQEPSGLRAGLLGDETIEEKKVDDFATPPKSTKTSGGHLHNIGRSDDERSPRGVDEPFTASDRFHPGIDGSGQEPRSLKEQLLDVFTCRTAIDEQTLYDKKVPSILIHREEDEKSLGELTQTTHEKQVDSAQHQNRVNHARVLLSVNEADSSDGMAGVFGCGYPCTKQSSFESETSRTSDSLLVDSLYDDKARHQRKSDGSLSSHDRTLPRGTKKMHRIRTLEQLEEDCQLQEI